MLTTYRRLFDLLDARERRRFWLLFGMVLVMGLLDALGVASILPFLAVLSNPQVVQENRWLASVYQGLGFAEPRGFLIFLGLVTFCLVVLGQVFKAVTAYTLLRFARMREFTIGSRLLSGYLHQPYEWFLGRHSAELGRTVLSEVNKAIEGVVIPALRLMAQSVVLIFLAALLLILNPLAAGAAAILVGGAYSAIYIAARHRLERLGRDRLEANEERFRMAQEALGAVKEVKAMGLEKRYAERFRGPAARFARRQAAIDAIFETPRYLLEAIVFGGALVLLIILLTSEGGRLEAVLPIMGVFAFAGARMFPAMQIFYRSVSALRAYRPVLDLLHADLRARGEARPPAAEPLRLRRRLELVGVEYAYPGSARPALDGLTLAIEANTTVGVVGRTGSGKTTAIDVILGLLRPQRGQVLVDGIPLDDTNLSAWQRNIGYVPQQIFLADDTIAANIAFGLAEDEIDMAAVERAARIAELHDFVVGELPLGYRARVGERGVRLSGGQRQRIGIARALYHDPDVLIFDEATSALDNTTEKAVMDAVRHLAHAKTIIMIAHRLSSLSDCDQEITIHMGQCSPALGSKKFSPGGHDNRPRATAS